MTIKEASLIWNISERRIRALIKDNRIDNIKKIGKIWIIPDNTVKPYDKRVKSLTNKYIISLPDNYFSEIDYKKNLLDKKRPFSKITIESLRANNILEWTYNSNAIEGNTLTLKETKVVLEGITIGGKSIKEHLEATNHKDAIMYLEELVDSNTKLTEWNIKNIHSLILKEIDNKNAGAYRTENVIILGAKHRPTDYIMVPQEMNNLIVMYENWSKYHYIIRAALLHGEFVKIHPFVDGNGRTARLLLNFELMKGGYPPIIIKKEQRIKYYEALDKAHVTSDYTDFIKLVTKCVLEQIDKYLEIIK